MADPAAPTRCRRSEKVAVMRFEIVTASGRGVHLAPPDYDIAICMRPVLSRTGREGSARTPHLCAACARVLAASTRAEKKSR